MIFRFLGIRWSIMCILGENHFVSPKLGPTIGVVFGLIVGLAIGMARHDELALPPPPREWLDGD